MRFITFSKSGIEAVGVRRGEAVVDLGIAAPGLPGTLLGLIAAGALGEAARMADVAPKSAELPLAAIHYLPLIPSPAKMVNLITNPDGSLPAVLGLSLSVHSRLAAHGQTMCVPAHFPQLQGGAELAVILGRGGRNISEVDAIGHIAGYSVFFGGVIYGLPPGQTVAIARNFDRTAPFGPELVTPDELPAGVAGLRMSLKRDGVIVQDGTVGQTWPVAAAIAGVSAAMTLEAGDVLTLGTLANARPDFLHEGETLEAEIAGIGTLRTVVVNNS